MQPLLGIRVLDFSTLVPGPVATLFLAEAGAEVIKVERPVVGEDMRLAFPAWGKESVSFHLMNRGKKSVTLDLKTTTGRDHALRLAETADILVDQFRPGVMDRLGLGYEAISKINPRIIYCSITGYGQTGPKASVAGHDLNYIGDAGLLSLSYGDPARPTLPPALVADLAGGAYPAVINILLALEERRRTDKGRHIDVSMSDNLFTFMYWALGEGFGTGKWPGNATSLSSGGTPRYRLYPARDGKIVAVAAIEQKFWNVFSEIIGLSTASRDDSQDPVATAQEVGALLLRQDGAYWAERFEGIDCCCSIILTAEEAVRDPHFTARGLFDRKLRNETGQVIPALPVPIDPGFRGAPEEVASAPTVGGQNGEFGVA